MKTLETEKTPENYGNGAPELNDELSRSCKLSGPKRTGGEAAVSLL
jgi:hypothetical protein